MFISFSLGTDDLENKSKKNVFASVLNKIVRLKSRWNHDSDLRKLRKNPSSPS